MNSARHLHIPVGLNKFNQYIALPERFIFVPFGLVGGRRMHTSRLPILNAMLTISLKYIVTRSWQREMPSS